MWVPNSERGRKMPSLQGENEIPYIPFFEFLTILALLDDKRPNFNLCPRNLKLS